MKTDVKTAIKRALVLSAPFLLISAAVILLSLFALSLGVEDNLYFKVATLAPEMSGDSGSAAVPYPEYTDEQKDKIQQNNEGNDFVIPSEFPIITLGEKWGTITIDSAGVYEQPLYNGDYSDVLMLGIGHSENSRFPGQHGKVVLSGHVGIKRFFQRLETMNTGDLVTLDTVYGKYVYQVTATYIYGESDSELLSLLLPDAEDTGDRLICYTCYPYRTTAVRKQRFVIDCTLVSGYDWITGEKVGDTQ